MTHTKLRYQPTLTRPRQTDPTEIPVRWLVLILAAGIAAMWALPFVTDMAKVVR